MREGGGDGEGDEVEVYARARPEWNASPPSMAGANSSSPFAAVWEAALGDRARAAVGVKAVRAGATGRTCGDSNARQGCSTPARRRQVVAGAGLRWAVGDGPQMVSAGGSIEAAFAAYTHIDRGRAGDQDGGCCFTERRWRVTCTPTCR